MIDSPIAPPIVHLARALGLDEIGTTVREMRRMTHLIREQNYHTSAKEVLAPTTISININNLNVNYPGREAVKEFSTSIYNNEIVALMGRNGAGKSSLLKAIAGIGKEVSGVVSVMGIDPQNLKGKQRRECIGYIPQEPSDLLYGQSVALECEQADLDNEIQPGTTAALLSQLVPGISGHIHPRDLSEGQRLGLALSVVLSSNPKVLILDEPTRGLDYQAKRELVSILVSFAKNYDKCVVLATHDVELVADLATRVIFIADGEKVADGSTLDVLLSSPAFAPQVAKVMSPHPWLRVSDVTAAIEKL
jgi:energy-coupling factor transport system ATP-binding protein